jgi:hypothetical protein
MRLAEAERVGCGFTIPKTVAVVLMFLTFLVRCQLKLLRK